MLKQDQLIQIINKAWEEKNNDISYANTAVEQIINELDQGNIRIASKIDQEWVVAEWIKKAIILSFKLNQSEIIEQHPFNYYDKIKLKFTDWTEKDFAGHEIRVVPGAVVRKSAYIGKNTVLMPSFINIGARIGDGTMIDSWSTVGSCAQIGKHCHISGGVGIGGVLEPIRSAPVIIEDNCFIGARSEISEGVIVEEGSVLAMGVYLGQSTRIYNRITKEISYGRIPPYSVVVPGTIPASDASHGLYAAIIVKQVDQQTRNKTAINDLLRN